MHSHRLRSRRPVPADRVAAPADFTAETAPALTERLKADYDQLLDRLVRGGRTRETINTHAELGKKLELYYSLMIKNIDDFFVKNKLVDVIRRLVELKCTDPYLYSFVSHDYSDELALVLEIHITTASTISIQQRTLLELIHELENAQNSITANLPRNERFYRSMIIHNILEDNVLSKQEKEKSIRVCIQLLKTLANSSIYDHNMITPDMSDLDETIQDSIKDAIYDLFSSRIGEAVIYDNIVNKFFQFDFMSPDEFEIMSPSDAEAAKLDEMNWSDYINLPTVSEEIKRTFGDDQMNLIWKTFQLSPSNTKLFKEYLKIIIPFQQTRTDKSRDDPAEMSGDEKHDEDKDLHEYFLPSRKRTKRVRGYADVINYDSEMMEKIIHNRIENLLSRCAEIIGTKNVIDSNISPYDSRFNYLKKPTFFVYNSDDKYTTTSGYNGYGFFESTVHMKKKLIPLVLNIEKDVNKLHDVFYKSYLEHVNEKGEEINMHTVLFLEHELSNIFAFVDVMKDDVMTETQVYIEDVIKEIRHHFIKKRYVSILHSMLIDLIKNKFTTFERLEFAKRRSYIYNLLFANLSRNKEQLYTCFHLFGAMLYSRVSSNAPVIFLNQIIEGATAPASPPGLQEMKSRVMSMEEEPRDIILSVYDSFMSSKLGSDIISVNAFDIFMQHDGPNKELKKLQWRDFIAMDAVRAYMRAIIGFNWFGVDSAYMERLIADSESNRLEFDSFRRMLTKDANFVNNLVTPRQDIDYPLNRVSICFVQTHGCCEISKRGAHNAPTIDGIKTETVPEGMTVYYFTDVLTDLVTSWSIKITNDCFFNFVFKELLQHANIKDKHYINEKDLLDAIISKIATHRDIPYGALMSSFLLQEKTGRDTKPVILGTARNVFLMRTGFIVKKYSGGDSFPSRYWANGTNFDRDVSVMSDLTSPGGKITRNETYTSTQLFDYAKKHRSRAIVLIDFSCKKTNDIINDRYVENKTRHEQMKNGKVIHMRGGHATRRKNKRTNRTHARTHRRHRRRSPSARGNGK